ncbi:MBL fold metallo-hydrolase [Alkalihalophilus lindianensis]|uniref:MBL fold metallo-hydrolase n=1 Tax=Alkalihalophilus lindianensis TaxID=1630542 RepID=A0ABU3XBD4_9BACI|nr:MBL fold metallo-hydrolase [Alkalihalophilus lindianensis]MDV2685196.1 MBL fold metallo-hydrolase [Alkalihalophilus lindianensis]
MELRILVDNNTLIDNYYIGEPALSIFIQEGNNRILFDTGYSDAFIKNAHKMGIDLTDLDFISFSHGHPDHTWGMADLFKLYMEAKNMKEGVVFPKIIGHPITFESKLHDEAGELGSLLSYNKLKKSFKVLLSREPYWISDKLVFLGEVKRKFDYEGHEIIGKVSTDNEEYDDHILDDTALVYRAKEGLVIIVGCAHSGICNIIEYAKEVCGEDRILDIIGGFHLLNPTENQLINTCNYISEIKPTSLHASHCTDLNSKIALSRVANLKEVGVGLKLKFE